MRTAILIGYRQDEIAARDFALLLVPKAALRVGHGLSIGRAEG
jgi:hypothetical protein